MVPDAREMVNRFLRNLDEAANISERLKDVDMNNISPILMMKYVVAINDLNVSIEKMTQTAKEMIVCDSIMKAK